MSKAWYVINSYSGYENKAKEQLLERIKLEGKEEQFGRIEIPTHEIVELKGGKEKIIRFGQQGVKGAGKNPKTAKEKARKKSYYARHNAQDSKPDIFSARYWSHKVKW